MCDYMWGNIRVFGEVYIFNLFNRGGQAHFFKSASRKPVNSWDHSAILKFASFLGVPFRKSQIHKFLWLICKLQIRKFLQYTALLCLKTVIANPRSVRFAEGPQTLINYLSPQFVDLRVAEVIRESLQGIEG
jgi:hypothetical protein